MAYENKRTIIGYLGGDPEIKYTNDGTMIAKFPVATTEKWKNKQGEKQERTEWHKILVFDDQGRATFCQRYLKKGSMVYLVGRLQTSSWEGDDGKKRYKTEIIPNTIQWLDRRPKDDNGEPDGNRVEQPINDDVPF